MKFHENVAVDLVCSANIFWDFNVYIKFDCTLPFSIAPHFYTRCRKLHLPANRRKEKNFNSWKLLVKYDNFFGELVWFFFSTEAVFMDITDCDNFITRNSHVASLHLFSAILFVLISFVTDRKRSSSFYGCLSVCQSFCRGRSHVS